MEPKDPLLMASVLDYYLSLRLRFGFLFKIKVRINTDNEVIAELDSDSHISLISEEYFDRLTSLGPIEFLKEPCLTVI